MQEKLIAMLCVHIETSSLWAEFETRIDATMFV